MQVTIKRHPLVDYLFIMIGTTFLALAIRLFFDPLEMVIGGVTGLAIILKSVTSGLVDGGIPLHITNIVINIPLFAIAFLVHGKDFGLRSVFATFYLSIALYYTQYVAVFTDDLLLASVFGGALSGIGLGLVFSAFATTGGTDLAASLIQKLIRHISVARIMMVLDGVIIILGFFIFGPEKTMYAIVSVYIATKVIDGILEGLHFSKAAFIISEQSEQISHRIFDVIDRGVTGLEGQGMYTNSKKQVLLCVVSKREIVKLKEIVRDIDRDAFVIVADVREVLGEGFVEY